MGLCQSFGYNFKGIGKILKHKEFSVTLLFFLIQGLLIPNFDDIHFVFLTEKEGMANYKYDFLNMISYISLLGVVILYNQLLAKVEAWILVLVSLMLFLVMTSLMLVNALRINVEHGVSDEVINGMIFFFGT